MSGDTSNSNDFAIGQVGDSCALYVDWKDDCYKNLGLLVQGQPSFAGGEGMIYINNASVEPPSNPSGGGVLYCKDGALKYKSPNGIITTLAAN